MTSQSPPTPMRIVVCGISGRMGNVLRASAAQRSDIVITGGIAESADRSGDIPVATPADAGELIANADAIIDFSSPGALTALIESAANEIAGKALIIGTTGLDEKAQARIDDIAGKCAVVTAANFSVGVNVLLDLVSRAAAALDDGFDIEIVEAHHRRKVDAPSGTALAIGRAAAEGRGVALDDVRIDGRSGNTGERPNGQIAFHALRGGSVVGEHRIHFLGGAERVELAHIASDRALFADGAITAALWARDRQPGHYSMRDVLGL